MLDIPTARTNRQARKTAAAEPIATQPTTAMSDLGAGTTSLGAEPTTALSQTTPYEYAGKGWQDPIAQQVMKDYYANTPGYSSDTYNQLMGMTGSNPNTLYNSPLSPESWGSVYRGQDFADIADKYKAAGGTYYGSQTPAQQAGVPYYTATGEPAPVMNMQTGVSEIPTFNSTGLVTGHTPAPVGGSGSYFSLQPEVISKMWR